ncbi:hypothetical protein N9L68_05970 [bacterium]|nr:hypothetical protein [bacterium]
MGTVGPKGMVAYMLVALAADSATWCMRSDISPDQVLVIVMAHSIVAPPSWLRSRPPRNMRAPSISAW